MTDPARIDPAELARKLWARDAGLWSTDPAVQAEIADRLGWLRVAELMEPKCAEIMAFAGQVRSAGFTRALLLGMGGSSLAPLVFQSVLGAGGALTVEVVDTTDPAQVRAAGAGTPPEKTLYIVSSKSGGTIEVDSLFRHFWEASGGKGERFVAITDPGTNLFKRAVEKGFRRIFTNPPDIGGRYSALSYFGLVPCALSGADVALLLNRAVRMMRECNLNPPDRNPGLKLGLEMGRAWEKGRDKLTLALPPLLEPVGLWIEQLIAESTGKLGKGIVPVAGEPLGEPGDYSADRLFVALSVGGEGAPEGKLKALEAAGHPVIRLAMKDGPDLGAELFRWEFATAVAGAYLAINPFDQPNVQKAKVMAKKKLGEIPPEGGFPPPPPGDASAEVRKALASLRPGKDYTALLAFLPYDPAVEKAFKGLQAGIRDRFKVASTFGFGPRYLHSTGQLHKGGDNNGVFFVFACGHGADLGIPGQKYSFAQLERCQALGDFEALTEEGRRVVFIMLPDASASNVQKAIGLFS